MDEPGVARRDYWPFLALEAATLIAGTGNGVAAIALPWLTLQMTEDPAAAGVVVAAAALPQLVASLASGVIIDRLGRQRTSVGSDVASMLSAALIPVFGLLGVLTYPLLLAASVLGAIFDPVGVTAREALLPDVAARARLRLERVNGVHEAVWGLAWLIGPGVAGLLIGLVGATASFWAMAAGFAVSALLVGMACMPTPPAQEHATRWLDDALEGARFVWHHPAIRATNLLMAASFTLVWSAIAVVLPVVYERMDRPEALGLLFVAFSGGGIVGSLAYGAVGERWPRRPVFAAGLIAAALMAAAFALDPPYWAQVALMAAGGLATGPVSPIANIVLQERAAERMRGRALSFVFALDYALFPVGYVAAGLSVRASGTATTFALLGAGAAVVAAWATVTPALKGMGAPE